MHMLLSLVHLRLVSNLLAAHICSYRLFVFSFHHVQSSLSIMICPYFAELKDDEISCEGWNDMEDAYVFRYAGTHPDMWKAIEVKGTPLGDMLMVDAAPIGSKGEETSQPCHLAIKVTDFASEVEAKSYVQQYKSLEGLVNLISSSLVDKLGKVSQSSSTTSIGYAVMP
ncbi:hypothetical protein O6H91_Y512000 [Diphasiastrum complanatum]|nr:hypothetical protein O6H91_Y512000 [Diphasiastrum complanatum]